MASSDRSDPVADEAFAGFRSMISDADVAPGAMATLLDALPGETRTCVVRRLGPADQKALYAKVEGYAPVSLVDLVPASCADLDEVRHLGRNSLPAFRIFEKRFCRPLGESAEAPLALAGYNFQTMSPITGPGYFMARDDEKTREVLVDYTRLPDRCPEGWPAVRPNERGLARFVYGYMVDRLRRVSEHVTIGSAARKGRDLGSYFVLNRAE